MVKQLLATTMILITLAPTPDAAAEAAPPAFELFWWVTSTPSRLYDCAKPPSGPTDFLLKGPFFEFNNHIKDNPTLTCTSEGPHLWDRKQWYIQRIGYKESDPNECSARMPCYVYVVRACSRESKTTLPGPGGQWEVLLPNGTRQSGIGKDGGCQLLSFKQEIARRF